MESESVRVHEPNGTQPMLHRKWLFLAAKLERHPELLDIAVRNIRKWKENGRHADTRFLDEWQKMILVAQSCADGMDALLNYLRLDGEGTRELKSCSPFAGVLTREERDQFTCAWTH
ncbi:MAG: hypothetical protein ACPG32_12125 [Akkermansiaceae bacterium]